MRSAQLTDERDDKDPQLSDQNKRQGQLKQIERQHGSRSFALALTGIIKSAAAMATNNAVTRA